MQAYLGLSDVFVSLIDDSALSSSASVEVPAQPSATCFNASTSTLSRSLECLLLDRPARRGLILINDDTSERSVDVDVARAPSGMEPIEAVGVWLGESGVPTFSASWYLR